LGWSLITRTSVPVISQPAYTPQQAHEFGLGDIQLSACLSPEPPVGGWLWCAGFVAQRDTATEDRLGQGACGPGPTAGSAGLILWTWASGRS
jgi:hypothetical protein